MGAKAVRQSVAQHKGLVTWEYSQSDFATMKIIAQSWTSITGICKALAAQWIVDHAYGGSLVKRVVGANGRLNDSAILRIQKLFVDWSRQGGEVQSNKAKEWLLRHGILQRGMSMNSQGVAARANREVSYQRGYNDPQAAQAMANHFRQIIKREKRVRMGGSYCQISFDGAMGGHAVAAWLAEDALFFDPNNGEYWFENANDFCTWYPTYFRAAGYESGLTKMLRGWGCEEFALAARWKSAVPR